MRYAPKHKLYQDWASQTIYRYPIGRDQIAGWARQILRADGPKEAKLFLAYLSWLGTLPTNRNRWRKTANA